MSVVTVFFDIVFPDLLEKPDYEVEKERIEMIRRRLVHAMPYLRSRLTQEAGLKYAPELRFFPYRLGGTSSQIFVRLMQTGVEDHEEIIKNFVGKDDEELEAMENPTLPSRSTKKLFKKKMNRPKSDKPRGKDKVKK